MTVSIGAALDTLFQDLVTKADDDPSLSYTAQLLAKGRSRVAKKVGEEGVELALAIASGNKHEIASETADLLYHVVVGLLATHVAGEDVAAILDKRRGVSGIVEKASRGEE